MIYSDGIHITADNREELHAFATRVGIPSHYYHGTRKGHPHYDRPNYISKVQLWEAGIYWSTPRTVSIQARKMTCGALSGLGHVCSLSGTHRGYHKYISSLGDVKFITSWRR